MRKTLIMGLFVFFVVLTSAGAHPPSDMELSYDRATQTLHLEMKHVVRNASDHRIRRVTVTVNDQEPLDFFFAKQTSNADFIEDVTVPIPEGEAADIQVKAFCSKAGTGEASLQVKKD